MSAAQIAIVTGRKNNEPEEIIAVQNGFNAHGEANQYRVIIANEKAEVGINLQRGTQAVQVSGDRGRQVGVHARASLSTESSESRVARQAALHSTSASRPADVAR